MSPIQAVLVVGLLVAGVVARALPQGRGGQLLSLAGVYLYWWQTGFSEPSLGLVAVLTLLVGLEQASGMLESVLTKKVADVSPVTMTLASAVASVLYTLYNFWGFVFGLAVTTFVIEFLRRKDLPASLAATVVVVLATFAKRAVKLLVGAVVLLVMLAVILL